MSVMMQHRMFVYNIQLAWLVSRMKILVSLGCLSIASVLALLGCSGLRCLFLVVGYCKNAI